MMMMQDGKYLVNIDGVVSTDIPMPAGTTFGFKILLPANFNNANNNLFGLGVLQNWPIRKCVTFYKSALYYNRLVALVCDGDSSTTDHYERTYLLGGNIDEYIEFDQFDNTLYINGILKNPYVQRDGTRLSSNFTINIFNIAGTREADNPLYFEEFYVRDSNGVIIHKLVPSKQNGAYGVEDVITGTFHIGDGVFAKRN